MRYTVYVICVLCMLNSCLSLGGYVQLEINDEVRDRSKRVISSVNSQNNDILNKINLSSPRLVFYATQLVSGLVHVMVFEIEGLENESKFGCVKVYERWDGVFTIEQSHLATSVREALSKCGVPQTI